MIDPHRIKYHNMYWSIAYAAASQSVATRRQVGACLVTPTGMISIGWNGMPVGFENYCEDIYGKTKKEVIHAERNAIDKMTRQGVSTYGSVLFVTTAPCFECAKAIHSLGFKAIHYDDIYSCNSGVEFLKAVGIPVYARDKF